MIDALIARLNSEVPALHQRASGVLSFTELMNSRRLPENANAYICPNGIKGGKAQDGTGVFSQELAESYSVVLVASSQDKAGRKALAEASPLITAVIAAVAGWAPEQGPGVFQVGGGRLLGFKEGRMFYELVFSINTQLRIPQ